MKKYFLLAMGAAALFLVACKKDKKTDDSDLKIPYSGLSATSDYFETFKGSDGNTSVSFTGQTQRIKMLQELDAYIKKGTTQVLDAAKMEDMFRHQNSPFAAAELNAATDKTIISKTAQSFATAAAEVERQRFLTYFDQLETASANFATEAVAGTAGYVTNGTSKYLVDAKGFEYAQFVQKGLIGAMLLDQIANIYLGTEKMAADNVTIIEGKNYTALEHNWDEAYGYLTANATYPMKDPADNTKWKEVFLGSYLRQVGFDAGEPQAVFMAYLTGRAAIVNKDLAKRNEQINSLRAKYETAIATIAISYLNKTKSATNNGAKFHSLSEGIGFLYALRYAYAAKIDAAKSDQLMNALMSKPNGFWDLTNADIDAVRDQIANLSGVDKNAVVNH